MTTQTKTKIYRFCKECGRRKIFDRFCLWCFKNTNSNIHIVISETMILRDSIRLRKYITGVKKFIVEIVSGCFPTKGKLAKKLPEGVHKSRVIDREKDEYHEVVQKYGTEKIIHECHEPLSQHRK